MFTRIVAFLDHHVTRVLTALGLLVLTVITLINVPDDLAKWQEAADKITSEHVRWAIVALMAVVILWLLVPLMRRRKPPNESQGESIVAKKGTALHQQDHVDSDAVPGPEVRVHVGWIGPLAGKDDLEQGRIGFQMIVFNGNDDPIQLEHQYGSRVVYGDRIHGLIRIDTHKGGVPPLSTGLVSVYLAIAGALSEELRSDIKKGRLQGIFLDGLNIEVVAGARRGRLRLPDGVQLFREDHWGLCRITTINAGPIKSR